MGSVPAPRVVRVDGRRMRWSVAGEGCVVLLVHGLGRSLEDWGSVQGELARDHRVYTVDLPGFGESERLPVATDVLSLARSLDAFLAAVGEAGPLSLIGNSLGGGVALQFAALWPGRTEALVLVDSIGFGREVTAGLRILAVPGLRRLLLRPSRLTAVVRAGSVFHDPSYATDERIALQYWLAGRPGASDVFLELARSLGDWRGIRTDWWRRLAGQVAALRIPTLLLWGTHDRILPASQLEVARSRFPAAEAHTFPQAGHMPQIEAADEFVDVVRDFLSRSLAGPPGQVTSPE